MSLKYSFNKGSADPDPAPAPKSIIHHESDGHAQHLCLVMPQGPRTFLNYAFLIAGEYAPEKSTITLTFTAHSVTLQGHRLESLFNDLAAQKPKEITAIEERYAATTGTAPHVTNITVKAL